MPSYLKEGSSIYYIYYVPSHMIDVLCMFMMEHIFIYSGKLAQAKILHAAKISFMVRYFFSINKHSISLHILLKYEKNLYNLQL